MSEKAHYFAVWWDPSVEDLCWGPDVNAPPYAIYLRRPVGGILCLMTLDDQSFQQHVATLASVALQVWRFYHQEMEQSNG